MAMLAERRSKQKWSVDPSNSAWVKDTEKYGYKMMQKMGWSEGKGLGTNESGETSHIKIKHKRDSLGLGATTDHDYAWLGTQDVYNQLLSGLNESLNSGTLMQESEKSETVTVAKAIQSRRAAMFYGRFKKSKDTSNYSSDDLSCILGTKDKRPKRLAGDDTPAEPEDDKKDLDSKSGVVTITRSESIQDYFARLTAAKRGGAAPTPAPDCSQSAAVPTAESESESESESDKKAKKRKSKSKDDSGDVVAASGAPDTQSERKSKKSKKEKKEKSEPEAAEEEEQALKRKKSKKEKKDKKQKKDSEERKKKKKRDE